LINEKLLFYSKLNRDRNSTFYFYAEGICWVISIFKKGHYGLPYFAIRKSGIDYIFKTFTARKIVHWSDVLRVVKSKVAFIFYLKSGGKFQIQFRDAG